MTSIVQRTFSARAGAAAVVAIGVAFSASIPRVVDAGAVFDSAQARFEIEVVASGLEHPWALAFLPDRRMLVTERRGRLRVVDEGRVSVPLAGLPQVYARGQGGLLDVAVHPDFTENHHIYLAYAAAGSGGAGTEVVRARLHDDRIDEVETIFRALPKAGGGRHFGSRLLFAPDGKLLVTLGDRGHRPNGQNLGTHTGSIIRVELDGAVPDDNPFVSFDGVRPEILTFGNRNVQGIAAQPGSARIWAHEHGPQGGDEINIVRAGTNYGWASITYGRNYGIGTKIGDGTHREGVAPPVHQWTPSIAPSGMAFYSGDKFSGWRGDLFVGSLKFATLVRFDIDDDRVVGEERLIEGELGRIRDVRMGPDGYLYILNDDADGVIARLVPRPL